MSLGKQLRNHNGMNGNKSRRDSGQEPYFIPKIFYMEDGLNTGSLLG